MKPVLTIRIELPAQHDDKDAVNILAGEYMDPVIDQYTKQVKYHVQQLHRQGVQDKQIRIKDTDLPHESRGCVNKGITEILVDGFVVKTLVQPEVHLGAERDDDDSGIILTDKT